VKLYFRRTRVANTDHHFECSYYFLRVSHVQMKGSAIMYHHMKYVGGRDIYP